jgi:hypothetical protein
MKSSAIRHLSCQQALLHDASVFSAQWMSFPAETAEPLTPTFLLDRYLEHIRSFTIGIIRPFPTADGVEFRLTGTGKSLISLTDPEYATDGDRSRAILGIRGGALVQAGRRDRGELSFLVEQEEDDVRITLQLTGYFPLILGGPKPARLRKWLYRLTQAHIHKVVTVRFLASLYRELAGTHACIKVKKVEAEEGEIL